MTLKKWVQSFVVQQFHRRLVGCVNSDPVYWTNGEVSGPGTLLVVSSAITPQVYGGCNVSLGVRCQRDGWAKELVVRPKSIWRRLWMRLRRRPYERKRIDIYQWAPMQELLYGFEWVDHPDRVCGLIVRVTAPRKEE